MNAGHENNPGRDAVELLRRLAARARAETAPEAGVVQMVMRSIRASGLPVTRAPSLAFTAGASAAAAAAAVLLACAWQAVDEPLAQLFVSLQGVVP